MEALLVKVFATALALSLVMTRPDAVKTQFDPATDKAEVLAVLSAGCDAMKKSFDIENIDLDGLIDTVMIDKQAAAAKSPASRASSSTTCTSPTSNCASTRRSTARSSTSAR
jgi:hypothetical protein